MEAHPATADRLLHREEGRLHVGVENRVRLKLLVIFPSGRYFARARIGEHMSILPFVPPDLSQSGRIEIG